MDISAWEKAAVIMSGLALLVSVVTPVVAYYWFDPIRQQERHAPKLEVTNSAFVYLEVDADGASRVAEKSLGVVVKNRGRLPAREVKVVLRPKGEVIVRETRVEIDPPSPHRVEINEAGIVVTLERVVGRDETVSVTLAGLPGLVELEPWVYYEQGGRLASTSISGCTAKLAETNCDGGTKPGS